LSTLKTSGEILTCCLPFSNCGERGALFNDNNPIIETVFVDESRLTGVRKSLVLGTILAIRPNPKRIRSLAEYIESGVLTHKDDPRNKKTQRANFCQCQSEMHFGKAMNKTGASSIHHRPINRETASTK
jgi:hypothetical protein